MIETRFEDREGVLVITPMARRLDAEVAPEFRKKVGDQSAGRSLVVLSLESVTFMDSSGLAGLISIVKRLAPGGQLRLAAAAPPIRQLLKLTRLETLFPVYDDVQSALTP